MSFNCISCQQTLRRSSCPVWLRTVVFALAILGATAMILVFSGGQVQASSGQLHVVAQGERLASIARLYCTTWQELHDLNRSQLGNNPDHLPAGITLNVINRCGSGGSGGVYDRGPTHHARGTVSNGVYAVVHGDTIFSIANRFGVDQHTLMRVNGVHKPTALQAGSRLTIPGLGGTMPPPIYPTPNPTPTPTPSLRPFVTIISPTEGARLPSTFVVTGRGGRLFEGNVVVQAFDRNGVLLAERATTLQASVVGGEGNYAVELTVNSGVEMPGVIVASSPTAPDARASVNVTYLGGVAGSGLSIVEPVAGAALPATFSVRGNGRGLFGRSIVVQAQDRSGRLLAETATFLQGGTVGAGGEGVWSAQLSVAPTVDGQIIAFSPGTLAFASVPVRFNGGSVVPNPPTSTRKIFGPNECSIEPRANAPGYSYPRGSQSSSFGGGRLYAVESGVFLDNSYWYYVDTASGPVSAHVWVRRADLAREVGSCIW